VLHRALTTAGITNIVVNPASVAVAANDKVKTDRRDAKKLARDLADGRLRGIYVPTEAEELARLLPRTRAQLVAHRATLTRQIKAKLHQFGLIPPTSRRLMSSRYLREIAAWELPTELRVSLTLLADQWRFATRQLLEVRRLLREQAKGQVALETVYRSVPGVGEVVARTLATELGDMTRFANERALFSYTGLTPSEYSSGTAIRRGHISRQGVSRLRHVLVETAWRALPRDPILQAMFDRIAATRGKQRAIVAIARRLIGRIRACFRHGTTYAVGTVGEASRPADEWHGRMITGGTPYGRTGSGSSPSDVPRDERSTAWPKRSPSIPAGSCTHEPRGICDFVSPLVPALRPARAKV
jgi:transposase